MMTQILAEVAGTDPMISGNWLIAVIGALASAGALILGKMQGRKEAQSTRLEPPVPEVPIRKNYTPPTWDAHRALCDRVGRIEEDLTKIKDEMREDRRILGDQFTKLMESGAERELRITEKIEGFARAIHSRIDQYLKPTRTR